MQVILRENVDKLGIIGDLVRVSEGYARNYLFPRRLAVMADEKNKAQIEHNQKVLEKKRLAQKGAAEELAKRLSAHSCTLKRKAENDKLFGSITNQDIAEELTKAGFKIEKHQIHVGDPIKTLGVHEVTVKLQPDVQATMKVWAAKE